MGDVNLEIKLKNLGEDIEEISVTTSKIDIENANNNEALVYNESTGKFEPKEVQTELSIVSTSTTDLENSADGYIRSLHLLGRGEKVGDKLITSEGIVESKNEDNTKSSTINASEILSSTFTGVNDIKDELIVNADGSGKFIKRVGKSKLTAVNLIDATTSTFWDSSFQNKNIIDTSKTILCNRLDIKTYAEVRTNHLMGVGINNDGNIAFSVGSGASTVKEMNAILATNPIEIIYVLTTPTETDLTPQQVSALLSLKTFDGLTIINADCEHGIGYFVNSEVGKIISDINSNILNQIKGMSEIILGLT